MKSNFQVAELYNFQNLTINCKVEEPELSVNLTNSISDEEKFTSFEMKNSARIYTNGSDVNYTVTIDGKISGDSKVKVGSLVEGSVWQIHF